MNRAFSRGNVSVLHFHYLLATVEEEVKHFEEKHELTLFTQEKMKSAFVQAGLQVEYVEKGLDERGLCFGK